MTQPTTEVVIGPTPAYVFDLLDHMLTGSPLDFHGHAVPADVIDRIGQGFTRGSVEQTLDPLPALTDALTGNVIQKIDAGARLFYALYHHPSAQGLLRASDSWSRDLRAAYRSAAGAYLPRDLWTDHEWRIKQDQIDAPPAPPS